MQPWLSFAANTSSNATPQNFIAFGPDATNRNVPLGNRVGDGLDLSARFTLFGERVRGAVTYFETNEENSQRFKAGNLTSGWDLWLNQAAIALNLPGAFGAAGGEGGYFNGQDTVDIAAHGWETEWVINVNRELRLVLNGSRTANTGTNQWPRVTPVAQALLVEMKASPATLVTGVGNAATLVFILADVSRLTPARCREIARPYQDAGITLHSLGVYTNLIHADAAERQANLDYFAAMMDIGGHMGVRTFITEAGHHLDPKAPEPRIAHHFQDAVWLQMLATARQLATLAEKRQATVLLEGFYRGFLASAKRLRMFLEEVNSPRIRALLDPANLIEVNDLEEMFQQLSPWIDCFHAKDRKVHVEKGVPAGQGSLDYAKFVTLAARHHPTAPLILEYVGPTDYRAAVAHLRTALAGAGLAAD